MPSLTTDQGSVHYEVYGRGRPVILLHGYLGSCDLWLETMTIMGRSCRTYALDFWGFGESGKKQETFEVGDYASMVNQFMQTLGIARAPLVGHSMGGTVSLMVAMNYPELVQKVVVIGSPVIGSSLSLLLKLFGTPWIGALVYYNLWAFRLIIRVLAPFYTKDRRWPQMMDRDTSRTTLKSFSLSIASLHRTDLRPRLDDIQVPVMGMYGDKDIVVDPGQWQLLQAGVRQTTIERFPNAGHFIMLDEPGRFITTLCDFLFNEAQTS